MPPTVARARMRPAAGHFHEQVCGAPGTGTAAGDLHGDGEKVRRKGRQRQSKQCVTTRELTQVRDARILGLDVVGGAQEGADLGDERLRELLAVEMLHQGRRRMGVPCFPLLLLLQWWRWRRRRWRWKWRARDILQRAAGRAHLDDLQLHRSARHGGGEEEDEEASAAAGPAFSNAIAITQFLSPRFGFGDRLRR